MHLIFYQSSEVSGRGLDEKAAGAEAMRKLAGVNSAADAVNRPRRRVDFAELSARNDAAASETKPKRRFVDWSKMAEGNG